MGSSIDPELVQYALVYPGMIVGAIAVLALIYPRVGTPLLIVTAALGGLMYAVCDSDNRSKQSRAHRYTTDGRSGKKSHFEREPVDMNRGSLTGRVLVLGAGLCAFAIIALSILYVEG